MTVYELTMQSYKMDEIKVHWTHQNKDGSYESGIETRTTNEEHDASFVWYDFRNYNVSMFAAPETGKLEIWASFYEA